MKKVFISLIITTLFVIPFNGQGAVQDEIDARTKQIAELQKQIDAYQKQILETGGKAKTLSTEITRLNAQISKIQLEITSLNLAIQQTDGNISTTQTTIKKTESQIEMHKKALAESLVVMHRVDQQSLTQVLLSNNTISGFFNNLKHIDDIQMNLSQGIAAMKSLKAELEEEQNSLEEKRQELAKLKLLQESQRKTLDQNKSTKDQLLKQTKGEESKYQSLLKQTQAELQRIREQITSLQQSGVSVEDAITYGKLTANRAGIRPAFLLAVLEVESRLGQNVGTGNWNTDMYQCYLDLAKEYPSKKAHYTKRAEDEKAAFFSIINNLGLNPDTVKVSKKPSYGCGGAMGPAQFIPTTWKGYEERIRKATGHANPNPWSIEDSFTAAAIKLANDGATAQTRAAEIRASKSYISGNANCTSSICNYYANIIQDKAAIIEANLR